MTKREKKTATLADAEAELRAAMESGELPDEMMAMAKSVLDGDPNDAPSTALAPLAVEDIQDSAPAKLQIVRQGSQVVSRLAPGSGWAHETFGLDAKHNDLALMLTNQLVASVNGRAGAEAIVNGTLAAIHSEQPKSALEAVLLTQLMTVNNLVARSAERFGETGITAGAAIESARLALQGVSTTAKLVDSLQKVRGKPSSVQKVIVERFEAQEGSQVIVGAVGGDGGGQEGGGR